jgi:hypothetical protein
MTSTTARGDDAGLAVTGLEPAAIAESRDASSPAARSSVTKKTWSKDPGLNTTRARIDAAVREAHALGPTYAADYHALRGARRWNFS